MALEKYHDKYLDLCNINSDYWLLPFRLGNVPLHVSKCGILTVCFFTFYSKSFVLSKVFVLSILLSFSCSKCLLPINLLFNSLQLCWNLFFVEQMRRTRKTCPNGTLCFKNSRCSNLRCKCIFWLDSFLQKLVLPESVLQTIVSMK